MNEELGEESYQQAGELAAARGDLAAVKLFISPAKTTSEERFL